MPYTPTTPIVKKLVDRFSTHPSLKAAFEAALKEGMDTGAQEFAEFNIHSLDDYLKHVDYYVHWVPTENTNATNVYNHLAFFYFILDQSPLRNFQTPIAPESHSPWTWLSQWLIDYAKEVGLWMDRPGSITAAALETFTRNKAYLDEGVHDFYVQYPKPPGGWKSFNEFFARAINTALRPIASPDDPAVIVSPADATLGGILNVDDLANVTIKGVPWNISQLLYDKDSNTNWGQLFAGGRFTHGFLNTTNYHRLHSPVAGRVIDAKVIPGICWVDLVVKKDPKTGKHGVGMHRPIFPVVEDRMNKRRICNHPSGTYKIEALDFPGYQFIQARGMILIESPELGFVVVLPVGMSQVSSVVLSVKPGDFVTKGDEVARFAMGGSDIVVVYQKEANIVFDVERPGAGEQSLRTDWKPQFFKFGSRIGQRA